ncbi:MAG: hypothetical protein COB66_08245 [Coxiella sp. (in: Bacteria)]|nr:MAG: hypothetical protein COB66_08245 [Coxiella sp. (in: g-proteobacteria)]
MKWIVLGLMSLVSVSIVALTPPPKTTIFLKKGESTFKIDITSNPTTGYSWFLGRCNHYIQPLSSKFYPTLNPKLIGAPGHVEWTFKLSHKAFDVPRVMKLQLLYMRPWDHTTATKKTFWIVTG